MIRRLLREWLARREGGKAGRREGAKERWKGQAATEGRKAGIRAATRDGNPDIRAQREALAARRRSAPRGRAPAGSPW